MAEKHVLAAIERELDRRRDRGEPVNWLKVHGHGMQRRGEPDLILCHRGLFVAAEVKQPGEKATKLQAHRLAMWKAAGGIVAVVHDVAELVATLDFYKEIQR